MTKQELIALLEQFPDDTIILVDGHSDGCDFDDALDSCKQVGVLSA